MAFAAAATLAAIAACTSVTAGDARPAAAAPYCATTGVQGTRQFGVVRTGTANATVTVSGPTASARADACSVRCCAAGPAACRFWSVSAQGVCSLFPRYAAPADASGTAAQKRGAVSGVVYYGAQGDPTLSPYAGLKGFNYYPASSMNDIDMWRDYNDEVVARDLQRAAAAGFNLARVWVNYVVWQAEGAALTAKLQRFVAAAHGAGIQVLLAPFNAYQSCVSTSGGNPEYNFTAACFFTSPASADATNPQWWASQGEAYVDALVAALPAGTPGLLMWDVVNEPSQAWAPLTMHFLRRFKAKTATPVTFGAASVDANSWAVNGSTLASVVDVVSFHSYHSSWEGGLEAYDAATALARSVGKPVFTSELGCIARASSYDQGIELATAYGMGWVIWELMVLDRESEPGTVNRRNIHGVMYGDGTVRDPASIAAVRGFYLNRGTSGSAIAPGVPNEENHGVGAVAAARGWVAQPPEQRSVTRAAGILDTMACLLESSGTTPATLPVSLFARRLANNATLDDGGMAQAAKLLAAQADALAAVMDGPVGVNSHLAGHNTSQFDAWEPGIAVFHRPGHGGDNGSMCCAPPDLALCG